MLHPIEWPVLQLADGHADGWRSAEAADAVDHDAIGVRPLLDKIEDRFGVLGGEEHCPGNGLGAAMSAKSSRRTARNADERRTGPAFGFVMEMHTQCRAAGRNSPPAAVRGSRFRAVSKAPRAWAVWRPGVPWAAAVCVWWATRRGF